MVKTGRLCIAGLVVVFFMLTLAPFSSAQITPELLNQKWFMVSLSLKGYSGWDGDQIDGSYSGSRKDLYIYSIFDPISEEFTWTTCTPNSNGSSYSSWSIPAIHKAWIYGELYRKQVWDFYRWLVLSNAGVSFHFFNDSEDIMLVPILTMDIKLDGNYAFKSASFKTTACIAHWGDGQNSYVGSCKLSGKTVSADKVPQAVLDACGP